MYYFLAVPGRCLGTGNILFSSRRVENFPYNGKMYAMQAVVVALVGIVYARRLKVSLSSAYSIRNLNLPNNLLFVSTYITKQVELCSKVGE